MNNLENIIKNRWRKVSLETAVDLFDSAAAATGAYNLAGYIATNTDFTDSSDFKITTGLLALGAILGFKAKNIFKTLYGKVKRNLSRAKTIREISENTEFQERQGLKQGEYGTARKFLKTALTTTLGGALGIIPGSIGILPLCVYFGDNFKWNLDSALGSGPYAGAIVGAYSFLEMSLKNKNEKLATAASALSGIALSYALLHAPNLENINQTELWTYLGANAAAGIVSGMAGNYAYRRLRKE